MNDSELILNPATNRFVKRSSQTGKRLIKQLSMPSEPTPEPTPEPTFEPVQTALLQAGAEIVAENTPKFKHLSPDDTDALFKRLLLERLSIAPARKPKKKSKYRVVSSESESSD